MEILNEIKEIVFHPKLSDDYKFQQLEKILQFATGKISFDYDETLTTARGMELAKKKIEEGYEVFIISARQNKDVMLKRADELGIPHNRVFATGSNKSKIEKVIELQIKKHYDNNSDVVKELGSVGEKFFITTEYVRSSNVDVISYNDVLKEMVIRFNDGSTYTYYDVSLRLFDDIKDGNGVCITSGQNQYGKWKIGKSPSVGAAVYEKLVQAGIKYKKGGTII